MPSEPDRSVPRHVAIIMDGNGRWAGGRGLPRLEGHRRGAESVREVVRASGQLGVEVLTLYSFSTENWGRPGDEVAGLMALLAEYLRDELRELDDSKVRLMAIGELDRLPSFVRVLLDAAQEHTKNNTGLKLVLALSYGGRNEIVSAVRQLAHEVREGSRHPDAITAEDVAGRLYTGELPDPDLLIRTSGEMRLSNFLLWQAAYAEIYVTDVLWPDFRRPELETAIAAYASRQRRFGKTGSQVQESDAGC